MYKIILFLLVSIAKIALAGKSSGPIGEIIFHSIERCDPDITGDVVYDVTLKQDDDQDSVDVCIEFPSTFNAAWNFKMEADKWEDDQWKEDISFHGNFFPYVPKDLPKIWAELKKVFGLPKMVNDHIDAGKYCATDIRQSPNIIDKKDIPYGKFRIEFTMYKKDDKVLCLMIEADSNPK